MKAKVKTYIPTEEWTSGQVIGTGPRWRLLEEREVEVKRPSGRGRFAHLRPSSENFAKSKQEEIELEEANSRRRRDESR